MLVSRLDSVGLLVKPLSACLLVYSTRVSLHVWRVTPDLPAPSKQRACFFRPTLTWFFHPERKGGGEEGGEERKGQGNLSEMKPGRTWKSI